MLSCAGRTGNEIASTMAHESAHNWLAGPADPDEALATARGLQCLRELAAHEGWLGSADAIAPREERIVRALETLWSRRPA